MKIGILGSFCLSTVILSTVSADDWARKMIATQKIDFGVIATGSEAKKLVEIRNGYNQSVHISSVSTTCGCSAATPGKTTIGPGETGTVEVKMNTHKFRKKKDSNLIIRFDQPRYAEVRIPIQAYIRSDVVFDPGLVQFGNVDVGAGASKELQIRYAGRADWDIVDVKISNKSLSARLTEGTRTSDRVDYALTVKLDPSASAGRLRDLITIVTNDRSNPYVPLMVEGVIVPDISVTPSLVNFRRVRAGSSVSRQLVIKGKREFAIESVNCDGMADCFDARPQAGKRRVHRVPIQFNAPQDPGQFEDELIITIAGRSEPVRLPVRGIIN